MWLNLHNLEESGLGASEYIFLMAVHTKYEPIIKEHLSSYRNQLSEYITFVKGAKTKQDWELVRLSKKGKDFLLDELQEPIVDEEDKTVCEWLCNSYLKMGKEIGNKKAVLRYINMFRYHTGISKNRLVSLVNTFMKDEENMLYNNRLDYSLFKSPNAFTTRFSKEHSRIYNYYKKHEQQFLKLWEGNPDRYAE